MAVYRPPMDCPFCGGLIQFKYKPLTKSQRESFWCGDNGGEYENHDCEEYKARLRNDRLKVILGTQSNP